MRNRQRSQAPAPTPAVAPTSGPQGYDYRRFGRHRLRAPAAVLVDLPVPAAATARLWVATIWPDPRAPGGWARFAWPPEHERAGWFLPAQLAAGDVLEFGADTPTAPLRWYGIMDSYQTEWMTVQGPYPDPAGAHLESQRLLALERFLPALESQPPHVSTPCTRTPRNRSRRPHRHQ